MILLIEATGKFRVINDLPLKQHQTLFWDEFEPIRLSDDPPPVSSVIKKRAFQHVASYGDWNIWGEIL